MGAHRPRQVGESPDPRPEFCDEGKNRASARARHQRPSVGPDGGEEQITERARFVAGPHPEHRAQEDAIAIARVEQEFSIAAIAGESPSDAHEGTPPRALHTRGEILHEFDPKPGALVKVDVLLLRSERREARFPADRLEEEPLLPRPRASAGGRRARGARFLISASAPERRRRSLPERRRGPSGSGESPPPRGSAPRRPRARARSHP